VVDLVVKRGKPGTIRTLRETIDDSETWSKVQGNFMEQLIDLSTDTVSGTVSGKTVLNKLRSFGPETLDELLGPNRGKFEDELRKLAKTQIDRNQLVPLLSLLGAGGGAATVVNALGD
jgi:hypothetical protein